MEWTAKGFPEFLFPKLEPEQTRSRKLFAGFGCVNGVNILDNGTSLDVCCEHARNSKIWDYLFATKPTLPLIKHNECILEEPCMRRLTEKKDKLVRMCTLLKIRKGGIKAKQRLQAVKRIMRSLSKRYPDFFEEPPPAESLDSSFDDDSQDEEEEVQETSLGLDGLDEAVHELSELVGVNLKTFLTKDDGMFEEEPLDLLVNSRYTGGCLSCQKLTDDDGIVFFSRGPRMDHLYSLPVCVDGHALSAEESKSCSNQHTGEIYQVDSVHVQQEVYAVSRTENTCSLFKMCQDEDISDEESTQASALKMRLLDECLFTDEQLMHVSLSPFIPGEVLITCQYEDRGLVKLWSPGTRQEVFLSSIEPNFYVKRNWYHSYYASHPRNICVADRAGLALYDVRNSGDQCCSLLSPQQCGLHQSERIMTAIRHPQQEFYHFATTDFSVLLLDERFPNHQVLQWSHSLLSHPLYLSVACDVHGMSGEQLLLVSSQAVPETIACPFSMNVNKPHPPCGTGTSWRISRIDDFVHYAHKQGAFLTGQLPETPLIGVCALNHSQGEGGVSVLQLSSIGNLFCQNYEFMSDRDGDKTQSFGPGSEELFLDRCDQDYITRWLTDYESFLKIRRKVNEKKDFTWFRDEMLKDQIVPHILCAACPKLYSHPESTSAAVHDFSVCYNCRIKIQQSCQVRECALQHTISPRFSEEEYNLPKHISELDLGSPEQFDYTTQIIMKLWKNEDVMELVKKRDDEVTKSREEKFDKWKKEKVKKPASSEDEMDGDEDETDSHPPRDISDDIASDEAISKEELFTRADQQTSALSHADSRKRHMSESSRSSLNSQLSRSSLQGFGSIPSHLKQQFIQQADVLSLSSPRKKPHASSSPDQSVAFQSTIRSTMSRSGTPTPVPMASPPHTPLFSPVNLFSPELLNKKSTKLIREGTPTRTKKKKPQFPGFL